MRYKLILTVIVSSLFFITCKSENPTSGGPAGASGGSVVKLTDESFRKLVYDYDKNKEWKYEGSKPAIVDFYADWCAPCRQLSPLVEELAKEYGDRIVFYKVDTDAERMLAQKMGITGLPTLFFIPLNGKPQYTMGLLPKETLVKAINDVLTIK